MPSVNADWDILVNQPEPLFLDDGIYDAYALVDNASLADSFNLTFVWSGLGTPGTQSYELYDAGFNVLASGNTLLEQNHYVPAPSALWLIATGLIGLFKSRKNALYYSA